MIIADNDEKLPMSRYGGNAPVIGRLIALPTTKSVDLANTLESSAGFKSAVRFDFPAMPDAIELARSADYYVSPTNPVMPDGLHVYRGTRPLEIPFSFKLHAMDRTFCPQGALTLLQLAARLHAFVLPLSTNGKNAVLTAVQVNNAGANATQAASAGAVSKSDATLDATSTESLGYEFAAGSVSATSSNPPVTCFLDLIWIAENQPGISCVGYVKDVRVRLLGPWLKNASGAYNLPSGGEFEFTFVHHPSHGNNWTSNKTTDTSYAPVPEVQAYAKDVRDRLFNTRNLVLQADYKSFDPASDTASATDSATSAAVDSAVAQETKPIFDTPASGDDATGTPTTTISDIPASDAPQIWSIYTPVILP